MNNLGTQLSAGLVQAWAVIMTFVPKALLFLVILAVGFFVAKLLCRVVNSVLERIGFDRLVERGGIRRMLQRTQWEPSDILGTVVKYFTILFTLQLAFGIFGPNPVSDLLTRIVAYLPNVFVAMIILVIAGAIASGVKTLVQAAIGGLGYGRFFAQGAFVAVWMLGIFAALNHLSIAPAIVNGLFYAMLAVVAGSAIIAIGGGGIAPMRGVWHRMLNKASAEAPRVAAEAAEGQHRVQQQVRNWEERAESAMEPEQHPPEPQPEPRFRAHFPDPDQH